MQAKELFATFGLSTEVVVADILDPPGVPESVLVYFELVSGCPDRSVAPSITNGRSQLFKSCDATRLEVAEK